MKIKKQHRKKTYQHKLNRKRMHLKQKSTGNVKFKVINDAWNHSKSSHRNLKNMGLVNDPNKAIKIPNFKEMKMKQAKKIVNDDESEEEEEVQRPPPAKKEIAEILEKEARAPRARKFMLPKSQVELITYLLDKYGQDYKAMERDKKNYYQETWKQLRQKIKTFMGIPKQYGEYLASKGLLDNEIDEQELKKQAEALVMD
ncbi:Nucleolar protein 16 [Operophtera brumata]|uniref:Nucleolar protein 16 n=1 Tax=Operophtera brumata TaxID=104452 RepID=A0A0L7L2C7_OPEBR|nr:Nucleolar protein 16 [Operophtera brumata]KOB74945.1 Nucleolar protein 16 [Operophtera brumata]